MAFEPQITSIELKNKRYIESQKTQVVLNFQTNGQKIEKVLYAKSEICVGEITNGNLNANVSGNVETNVIVQTQEGIIALFSSTPFSVSVNLNSLTQDNKLFAEVQNLGVENIIVNEISLSLTQKLSVQLFMLETITQNYVSSISPANQKMETYELNTTHSIISENFETNLELEFPNSFAKLLCAESFSVVNSVQTSKDMAIIAGTIFTTVFYLTSDEVPRLKSKTYANDFSQDFLSSGTEEGMQGFAKSFVCKTNVDVDDEQNKEKGLISVSVKQKANIILTKEVKFEAVADAFCVRKEMQMDFSSFQTQGMASCKVFNDKIDGNFVLQDPDARIDKILLSAPTFATVSKVQIADNDVVLKGNAFVDLVFLLDDDAHTLKTEQVNIPFEISTRCDDDLKDCNVFATIHQKDVDARIKKSKEIDINIDVVVQLCVEQSKNCAIMSNLTVGEDRKQSQPNMGIYVVNDLSDLWETSKKLLINPQILTEQNPELTFPITKPTQIVVYRQKSN